MFSAIKAREKVIKGTDKYIKRVIKNINSDIKKESENGYTNTQYYLHKILSKSEQEKITSYYTSLGYEVIWDEVDHIRIRWRKN